jgi:hypothetical protein
VTISSISLPQSATSRRAASSFLVVSRQCIPGRRDEKGGPMYIGLGTLVFVALVLLIIYLVRRA